MDATDALHWSPDTSMPDAAPLPPHVEGYLATRYAPLPEAPRPRWERVLWAVASALPAVIVLGIVALLTYGLIRSMTP